MKQIVACHCGDFPAGECPIKDCRFSCSYTEERNRMISILDQERNKAYKRGVSDARMLDYDNGFNDGYEKGLNDRISFLRKLIWHIIFLFVIVSASRFII